MSDRRAMSATEIRKAVSNWAALGFAVKVDTTNGLIDVMPAEAIIKQVDPIQPVDLIQWSKS